MNMGESDLRGKFYPDEPTMPIPDERLVKLRLKSAVNDNFHPEEPTAVMQHGLLHKLMKDVSSLSENTFVAEETTAVASETHTETLTKEIKIAIIKDLINDKVLRHILLEGFSLEQLKTEGFNTVQIIYSINKALKIDAYNDVLSNEEVSLLQNLRQEALADS